MNHSVKIACAITVALLTSADTLPMQAHQKCLELACQNPGKTALGLTALVAGVWLIRRAVNGSTSIVPPTAPPSAPALSTSSSSSSSTSTTSPSIRSGATMHATGTSSAVAGAAASSVTSIDTVTKFNIDALNPVLPHSVIETAYKTASPWPCPYPTLVIRPEDFAERLRTANFDSDLITAMKKVLISSLSVYQVVLEFNLAFDAYCATLSGRAQTTMALKATFFRCLFLEKDVSTADLECIVQLITIYGPDSVTVEDGLLLAYNRYIFDDYQNFLKKHPSIGNDPLVALREKDFKTAQAKLAQKMSAQIA